MPVTVTYPGVYLEEIPSGNFTITGVATSITAFVGRTLIGPTQPMHCFSYAEFERHFGGRSYDYPLSYAVEDFFQNGGGDAVIVRVLPAAPQPPAPAPANSNAGPPAVQDPAVPVTATPAAAAAASALLGGMTLTAASPGTWANKTLTVAVDLPPTPKKAMPAAPDGTATLSLIDTAALQYGRYGVTSADLFNLTLIYTKPSGQPVVERFTNLTVKPNAPNRIDRVLNAQSQLAMVPVNLTTGEPTLPQTRPAATDPKTPVVFDGGADGPALVPDDFVGDAAQAERTGLYALDHIDLFNLLCIPWDQRGIDLPLTVYQKAAEYCVKRRAMLIIDPPTAWADHARKGEFDQIQPTDLGISGPDVPARNCAVYFPRVIKSDDEMGGLNAVFPACGIIAGVMAQTDVQRGVWKAPAGITAGIGGIVGLEGNLTDDQNGMLNPLGINCLRYFPVIGPVVWGARTLRGADVLSDDYKYVPVRRLTLYIEESLYRGTKFAVFEPNDETLWSRLRLTIGTFMADLARQGAFYQYQVACDKTTTTPYDIERGIVNALVAFAPVKPAEFVVLQIQQIAGQMTS